MIVLDTNVLSELMKLEPEPAVLGWAREVEDQLFLTTITIAEIGHGLERMPMGRRHKTLEEAAERYFDDFAEFVLAFDLAAARRYGALVATRERRGRPIGTQDAQIAAICQASEMTCATRNTPDFKDLGIDLINPWNYRP